MSCQTTDLFLFCQFVPKSLKKMCICSSTNTVTDNILHNGQSGFRHQHSTCTALIKTIDKWNRYVLMKVNIDAVFVDLGKAFDMVNHKIPIN